MKPISIATFFFASAIMCACADEAALTEYSSATIMSRNDPFLHRDWPPLFTQNLLVASNLFKQARWSQETNGLKVGIIPQYPPGVHTDVALFCAVVNTDVTKPRFRFVYFPKTILRYKMNLTDARGNEVPKTSLGKKLGGPIEEGLKMSKFCIKYGKNHMCISYAPTTIVANSTPLLSDFFKVKEPGLYHLDVEVRLGCPSETNEIMKVYYFPVKLDINIEKP
jgi:hypothetical protein